MAEPETQTGRVLGLIGTGFLLAPPGAFLIPAVRGELKVPLIIALFAGCWVIGTFLLVAGWTWPEWRPSNAKFAARVAWFTNSLTAWIIALLLVAFGPALVVGYFTLPKTTLPPPAATAPMKQTASAPAPSPPLPLLYRNEMGLGQSASLASDLMDVLRRDSPVSIVITAPDDENSRHFREDLRVILNTACSLNPPTRCDFPDLPNPKTNLDAAIPVSQFQGITVYQEEDSPSRKWGGPDYMAQILRCIRVHTSTNVPTSIERLKKSSAGRIIWFQIGAGSPWIPDVEKSEQCAPIQN